MRAGCDGRPNSDFMPIILTSAFGYLACIMYAGGGAWAERMGQVFACRTFRLVSRYLRRHVTDPVSVVTGSP